MGFVGIYFLSLIGLVCFLPLPSGVDVCGQKVPFRKTDCFNEYDQITRLQTGVPVRVTIISSECLV